MVRKFLCVVVAAVVGTAVLVAQVPSADAAAKSPMTVAAFRKYLVGKWTSGPNQYTNWQRVQLTGSHPVACGNEYDIDYEMHQYVNPLTASARTATRHAPRRSVAPAQVICQARGRPSHPSGALARMSWWNPFSWDWGHIPSSAWNKIWNDCLSGAVSNVVKTASGTLIWNLLSRGAKLTPGIGGYAALAFGGCVVGMAF